MTTEQDRTLDAVKTAIQMEIDGKEFYLKSSRESRNELGKELFKSLAAEEDIHRQKFVEVYEALRSENNWPVIILQPEAGKGLRTLFSRAAEELGSSIKAAATELDAIQTAMNMENKSYDFYKSREEKASYEIEKSFYQSIAAQESRHYLILLDYYEYLKDPAEWFVKKEHPSLDGG
ncbi:MAG: ferritin family protein [Dehalococcoidales bacterium]|nr:ferritin family protein [Dehalococcoidales bacterium]